MAANLSNLEEPIPLTPYWRLRRLSSRKLKRELPGHLSFKMQWKIMYGTKFQHSLSHHPKITDAL
jgi:hypothetical protein